MPQLLGPKGQPISSSDYKKAPPPTLGEKYGNWSGEQTNLLKLPGGGLIGFDLDTLTLEDFRQMKDHYQINSSLAILTFMMHQMEWHIESTDKKLASDVEAQLRNVWSRLVRAKSQSFWAGYSPNVLEWENDVKGKAIVLNKVKDLYPEDCRVHWKNVDGSTIHDDPTYPTLIAPTNKIKIYDGISQRGWAGPIPVDNTYWYPLLMENGNYYGKKLLRPAFQSWFFSILLHLFANRYYERFGEPTPVGRAPYDEDINYNGESMAGNKAMEMILTQLRNRSTVILPNDKTPWGDETNPGYDYTIEYLESQMRGADFEKYMTRLDEEMSLALFTPILLMRTADVGSYNLGDLQALMYQVMLNAISGDWATYLDKYIIRPIARYNHQSGENHPEVKIRFRTLGKDNTELIRDVIRDGITKGKLKVDVRELAEESGMTIEEIDQLTLSDDELEDKPPGGADPGNEGAAKGSVDVVTGKIAARVAPQVVNSYKAEELPDPEKINLGFNKQMTEAFEQAGVTDSVHATKVFYSYLRVWMDDAEALGLDTSEAYMRSFNLAMTNFAKELTHG